MKSIRLYHSISTLLLVLLIGPVFAQSTEVNKFQWIEGRWKADLKNGPFYENWKLLDNQTLTGEGIQTENGDTTLRESLRIQKIGNYWTYIAMVNGGKPVLFTLIQSENNQWVFENQEHDFPQRVIYSKQKDGTVLATVEGEINGKLVKDEYLLNKLP